MVFLFKIKKYFYQSWKRILKNTKTMNLEFL